MTSPGCRSGCGTDTVLSHDENTTTLRRRHGNKLVRLWVNDRTHPPRPIAHGARFQVDLVRAKVAFVLALVA